MLVVAITGGIGSGKTTVTQWIAETGIPILDADQISRELTAKDGAALPKLLEAFGSAIFRADGTLNRAVLAALVFTKNPVPRKKLNDILHPMIINQIQRQLRSLRRKGIPFVVIDVPLLYESGMEDMADLVICVTASRETRIERIMHRDGITEKHALARMRAQQDVEKTEEMADYIIPTDGTIEENHAYTMNIWHQIITEGEV